MDMLWAASMTGEKFQFTPPVIEVTESPAPELDSVVQTLKLMTLGLLTKTSCQTTMARNWPPPMERQAWTLPPWEVPAPLLFHMTCRTRPPMDGGRMEVFIR